MDGKEDWERASCSSLLSLEAREVIEEEIDIKRSKEESYHGRVFLRRTSYKTESLLSQGEVKSDEQIVESASGGLALQGVYKTGNDDDLLKSRQKLIKIVNCKLLGPQDPSRKYEFSSTESQEKHLMMIKQIGFSFSLPKVKVKCGSVSSQQIQSALPNKSSALCAYTPTASMLIDDEQILLSDSALKELKKINAILLASGSKDQSYQLCLFDLAEKFFEKFGSHAMQGPLHFGGTFWTIGCSRVSIDKNKEKHVLKVDVSNELQEPFSIGCGLKNTKVIQSELQQAEVNISVEMVGGPPGENDYVKWKEGLSKENWAVIDRGTLMIPVWKIIKNKHCEDFGDVLKLCHFLTTAYEKITKQNTESEVGEDLYDAVSEAKRMMEMVKLWCPQGPTIEKYLIELLAMKIKIKKRTLSFKTWANICLSNKDVQRFLLQVTKEENNDLLKFLMQFIMDSEIDSIEDFPEKNAILRWIMEEVAQEETDGFQTISYFSQLNDLLEESCCILKQEENSKVSVTSKVAFALKSWCETLIKIEQRDLEILVQFIICALGFRDGTFHPVLDLKKVELIKKKLYYTNNQYCDFRASSAERAQAFVLVEGLIMSEGDFNITIEQKINYAKDFNSQINVISCEIKKALNGFLKDTKLGPLINQLMSIKDGKKMDRGFMDKLVFSKEMQVEEKNINEDVPEEVQEELLKPFHKLFKDLNLQQKRKNGITAKDFVTINCLSLNTHEPTEVDLWQQYLYKLVILDTSVRHLSNIVNETMEEESEEIEETEDLLEEHEPLEEDEPIHPMDLHMAVFHCCDPFAKLYICQQLSTCQFALPLLVPDPLTQELQCPLWALKQIQKTWQSKQGEWTNHYVMKEPVPVVSFIRLEPTSQSKSQIMNTIINSKNDSIFFHRDMKNSTPNRILLEGVSEIFWYCTSGKKEDTFEDNVAFINLHGDVRKHPKQFQLIKDVSAVIVLLSNEESLNTDDLEIKEMLKSKKVIRLICGIEGKRKPKVVYAKNKSKANVAEDVKSKIKSCLKGKWQPLKSYIEKEFGQSIEGKSVHKIKPHEWESKGQALLQILKDSEDIFKLKETFLPLQGELWAEWCTKDKQSFRLQEKSKNREHQKAEIRFQKEMIRKCQCERASTDYKFMTTFLQHIMGMQPGVEYMLNWLQQNISDIFKDTMANIESKFHSHWTKVRDLCRDSNEDTLLKQLDKKIQSKFDFQHIMRECAQLYEAFSESKTEVFGQEIDGLPQVGAEMMLSGYPLEIIDGDVSHVPLTWVNAVLSALIQKIGDKKLFVLSVLGLQSSGKSTLLNTMFGLRFPVSSGRCTRGAYMQMVRVDENIRDQLHFDYVLVLDTEGLGSPEGLNKSRQHDNELATFIVGLSDLTLINIMGENPAVMKDTLQICFQAFLRMKCVNIKPTCIFVHQNVCDTTAKDNNKEGRRKFIEELDKISKLVAEEEKNQQIGGFCDVIQINIETQVYYFKSYLEGNPPMAHPNPFYSHNVHELKMKVLSIFKWQPLLSLLKISEFQMRIKDLWNGLLKEDFIFHFQNSLTASVFKKLEAKIWDWSWKLRRHALQMQLSHSLKLVSESGEQAEQINFDTFSEIYKSLCQEVEEYFEKESHCDILVQYKGTTGKRLEELKASLKLEVEMERKKTLKRKGSLVERTKKRADFQAALHERGKKWVQEHKDCSSNDEKSQRTEFEKIWSQWATNIANENPKQEDTDVQAIVEKVLKVRFPSFWSEIGDNFPKETFQFKVEDHIVVKQKKNDHSKLLAHGHEMTEKIETAISEKIKSYQVNQNGVSENLIHDILIEIENLIIQDSKKCFSDCYTAHISGYVCYKEVNNLVKLQREYFKENDPVTFFVCKKEEDFKTFRLVCQGALSAHLFVDSLMKHIHSAIEDILIHKVSIKVVDFLKSTHPAFCKNRSTLEAHIMKHLAEKENFEDFMTFIIKPKKYFEVFIIHIIDVYLLKNCRISKIFESVLSLLRDDISTIAVNVTDCVHKMQGSASVWLDEFFRRICQILPMKRENFNYLEDKDISDVTMLKNDFVKSLKNMYKRQSTQYQSLDKSVESKLCDKSCDILFKQLSGCWQQCPFCRAVCTISFPNHDSLHSTQWHRCKGLGNCCRPHFLPFTKDQFEVDFCSTSVLSTDKFKPPHSKKYFNFKEYRKAGNPYNTWSIQSENEPKDYWKWFVCKFQDQLQQKYKFTFQGYGHIPSQWKEIKKEDILKQLEV